MQLIITLVMFDDETHQSYFYKYKYWYRHTFQDFTVTKRTNLILISIGIGFLLFALNRGNILIYWPDMRLDKNKKNMAHLTVKRTVTLPFFKDGTWQTECQELLWHENTQENIFHLINALLNVWHDEHISLKRASLQSCIIDPSKQIAYLSFDHAPFHKHEPTYAKWLAIEGILKTLRDNQITIPNIYFLVNHKPFNDTHLDFENPWPLEGFSPLKAPSLV